ncbi:DUF262 domain-containing protein [Nodosilinea sp. LEGE 06152]|uniref:GmrSD restriction endonuclease domain-containing protein n=1 Tax=Nodosilinea sp. LEGE 06152 TaxID=2777966 RepID=UPI001882148E|nr:DUF262 domain-containing protein [Nodosilinea sp. LEGE 06152]MBE9160374.1 DUF262 domain-containing protein [Nodosilinea sp. LEGE 06152]
MKISQILDKIDENQLFVPAFQREYVWKTNDAKELIASLLKEYPTGTMLTWETNNPPELKGSWEYSPSQGAVKLILDGQQRITTLYMLIRGEIPPYYKLEEITHDTRNLYINVETLDLQYYKQNLMENNPLWVNLTDIFKDKVRAKNVVRALKEKGETVTEERDDLIDDNFKLVDRIPDREFVEQTIPVRASIKEAIDIFYVVNASGVNLTDAELALAQISGYWPNARELFKAKLKAMAEHGFVFKLDFLVYVILGVLHQSGSEMRKLHTPDNYPRIKDAWELLDNYTLDYVINILKTHAYVDHTKEINSYYALVPIIVYCFNKGKQPLSQQEIKKIVKWFYYSQIRQRYISQLQQKLDKDNGIVTKHENPFDELLNIIKVERPLEISTDEFVGVDTRNALWGLMRWYFKSRNAVCFTTGVGIRQNMGGRYVLEWDHVFPYSLLKEAGYSRRNWMKYALAQEITNRAVLTQTANRTKSNREAKGYLAEVQEHFPDALKRQSIPLDPELWKIENYEQFLVERRKMLATELTAFLKNITETSDTQVETSLEDLIQSGESSDLEFKSSLRWGYQQGAITPALEDVIMKSIAAFSNSDGGTLLIGVNDDGEVLGLENDYNSLNGTRDKFEVHLRNLVNKAFGASFAASNLTITFPASSEKEVCQIDIKRALHPQYLEVKDKTSGGKAQKFYVRSGNSSIELSLSEVSNYIQERFH